MNKQTLYVGIGLFLGGAIVQAIVQSSTGFEIDPLDGIFGFASFLGLILIIVGAVKGSGAATQQQQQQVVVYAGSPSDPAPAAPRLVLTCPTCKTLNEASARYCMECGHEIPQPRPAAKARPPAPPAGATSKRKSASRARKG